MSTAIHKAFLAGIMIVGAVAGEATAASTTETESFSLSGTGASQAVSFDQFDGGLGILDSVTIELESFVTGESSGEGFVEARVGFADTNFSFSGFAPVGTPFNGSDTASGGPLSGFIGTGTLDALFELNNFIDVFSARVAVCTDDCPGWYGEFRVSYNYTPTVSPVPVPAALPLLASALAGVGVLARRRKSQNKIH